MWEGRRFTPDDSPHEDPQEVGRKRDDRKVKTTSIVSSSWKGLSFGAKSSKSLIEIEVEIKKV